MKDSLLLKHVLPFVFMYFMMILSTVVLDFILHQMNLVFVGRYLGYVGTFLVVFSLLYSLRKRNFIRSGSPKKWLSFHEYLAWAGSVLLLVHAGIHLNALLPWLAVIMLLINVASGLVGKYLLNDAISKYKPSGYNEENIPNVELPLFDAVLVEAMQKWRVIHMPISILFGVFAILHILTIFMFSK